MKKLAFLLFLSISILISTCITATAAVNVRMSYKDNTLTVFSDWNITATLIHVSYDQEKIDKIDIYDSMNFFGESFHEIHADENDKFFLWNNTKEMKPLCKPLIVEPIIDGMLANGRFESGVIWTLSKDYVLTIKGKGSMDNYREFTKPVPWKEYKKDIQSVVVEDGVTNIGEYAFYGLTNVTNVSIGNDVDEISCYAFARCYNLTNITLPDNLKSIAYNAFCDSGLKKIIIPENVTAIGMFAFSNCYDLRNVTIPDSVKMIADGAFNNCTSLENITLGNRLENMAIGVFCDCSSLKEVTIPESITELGSSMFMNCSSLEKIYVSTSLLNYYSEEEINKRLCDNNSAVLIWYN